MFADLKQLPKCDIQTSDFAVVQKKKKKTYFLNGFNSTLFQGKVKKEWMTFRSCFKCLG